MKAEDTVMSDVTPVGLLQNQRELDGLLREQAELSFKAGIKEVVDFVQQFGIQSQIFKEWQSKLEEWGIDA